MDGNIGYLRLAPFMDFRQEFLDGICQNMNDFKNTQGLIIDIRGNGGGASGAGRIRDRRGSS